MRIHDGGPSSHEDSTVTAIEGPALAVPVGRHGPEATPEATPVPRIGRFVLLRRLGAGGMGVVYSAYDEDLDRRVAIKLLHDDLDDTSRRRMRREAQALARLSHPNVVGVYEVGEHAGRLYLVMEHVQGKTLREWLVAGPRTLPEILEVLRQAGEGLAAAHEAGLVHRDFKPANVLVADDGRTRVLDFGLARRGGPPADEQTAMSSSGASSEVGLAEELTQDGTVLGTPPYMSPEQIDGTRLVDARSDQFSFCVTLWEAIHGQRPFLGGTYMVLAAAIHRGRIEPPPAGKAGPAWVLAALTRGLSVEPEHRHPDMHALLAALARDRRRRGLWGLGAVGAVGVLGLGYVLGARQAGPACTDGSEQLEPLWGSARREAIHAALVRLEVPYAEATWVNASRALDEHTAAWKQVHLETCEAMQGPQSDALLDRKLACLDEQRRALRATVDVIEQVDLATIDHVVRIAAALPSPRQCSDAEALLAEVRPPPPELAEPVGRVRDQIADASATMGAGRLDVAEQQARAALADADGIDYSPLRVEAEMRLGRILHAQGQLEPAQTMLERAYWQALRLGYDTLAVEAGIPLIHIVGDALHRYDEGMVWMRTTEALAERAGVHDIRMAWVLGNGGNVLMRAGRYDEARTLLVAALELAESSEPVDPFALSSFLNNLGGLEMTVGEIETAHRYLLRSLEVREAALGDTHPLLVSSLVNLGNVEVEEGRLTEAQQRFERALVVLAANGNRDQLRLAVASLGLDMVYAEQGEYQKGYERATLALAQLREVYGAEHPDVAAAMFRVGEDLRLLGRFDEASEQLRQGLAIAEPTLGRGNPQVSVARQSLARIEAQRGNHAAAVAAFDAVAVDTEAALGGEHRFVGTALRGAGLSLLELGRAAEAVAALERALGILGKVERAEQLAELRFGLARALRQTGGDAVRAVELARRAREGCGEGEGEAELGGRIDAWLAGAP